MGMIEEVGGRIVRVIFPPLSAQNADFLSFLDRKAYTFFRSKKAKAFIFQCFDI